MSDAIRIGSFKFWYDADDKIWVAKDGGETMQCSEETAAALEGHLEQFWMENF
jgi:hypothetical protein